MTPNVEIKQISNVNATVNPSFFSLQSGYWNWTKRKVNEMTAYVKNSLTQQHFDLALKCFHGAQATVVIGNYFFTSANVSFLEHVSDGMIHGATANCSMSKEELIPVIIINGVRVGVICYFGVVGGSTIDDTLNHADLAIHLATMSLLGIRLHQIHKTEADKIKAN